jgi:acyl carrier protein
MNYKNSSSTEAVVNIIKSIVPTRLKNQIDNETLLTNGILDSLDFANLFLEIEQKLQLKVNRNRLNSKHLSTPSAINRYIKKNATKKK